MRRRQTVAGSPLLRGAAFPRNIQVIYQRVGGVKPGKTLPHPKENTMAAIAELSLEQIDSLFGLDDAPDIKADPHGPLVLPTVGLI